jgi:hypothetical protein
VNVVEPDVLNRPGLAIGEQDGLADQVGLGLAERAKKIDALRLALGIVSSDDGAIWPMATESGPRATVTVNDHRTEDDVGIALVCGHYPIQARDASHSVCCAADMGSSRCQSCKI